MSPRSNRKPALGQRSTSKKPRDLDELYTWARDHLILVSRYLVLTGVITLKLKFVAYDCAYASFPWKINRYSYGVQFGINCTALDQSKLSNFVECTIKSVIILVINKSDSRCAVVWFCYHSYDYRPNWTPLIPITITYRGFSAYSAILG